MDADEDEEKLIVIKCVVACQGMDGPDLVPMKVEVPHCEYDHGKHYEVAEDEAEDLGYSKPMVVFDENDGPAGLFKLWHWDTVDLVGWVPPQ